MFLLTLWMSAATELRQRESGLNQQGGMEQGEVRHGKLHSRGKFIFYSPPLSFFSVIWQGIGKEPVEVGPDNELPDTRYF